MAGLLAAAAIYDKVNEKDGKGQGQGAAISGMGGEKGQTLNGKDQEQLINKTKDFAEKNPELIKSIAGALGKDAGAAKDGTVAI